MAETKETVVFEIDVSAYEKKLAEITTSIDGLKDAQKKFRDEAKAGSEEAAKSLERVNAELKVQQQQYRTTQNVLAGFIGQKQKEVDVTNFSNNSIQQNRDLLKQLTAQYIGIQKPSQEATDKLNQLSATLKKQESAIGDTRRNVGNYKQDIIEAAKSLNLFGVNVGDVIDPLKKFKGTFDDAGGGINGIAKGLGGLAAGLIPFAIGAIGGLSQKLLEYKPVAEFAERATNGFNAGIEALVNGGSVFQAAKDVFELTGKLQELNDELQRGELANARNTAAIRDLEVIASDVSKTEEQRISILQKANEKAVKSFNEQRRALEDVQSTREQLFMKTKNLSQFELDIILENNESIKKSYDFVTDAQIEQRRETLKRINTEDDDFQAVKKGREEIIGLTAKYYDVIESNNNRVSKLQDKIDARDKQLADEKARLLEKQKADFERYWANIDALETQFELNERERLAKSFDDKIQTIKGDSQREIALRLAIEQEKEAALNKFDDESETRRQQKKADRLAKDQADLNRALAILEDNAQKQLELQIWFNESQQEIDEEYQKWVEDKPRKNFADFYAYKKKLREDDLKDKAQKAEEEKRIEQQQYEAAKGVQNLFTSLSNAIGEQTAAGLAFQKLAALTELAINTAKSLSASIPLAIEAASATGPAAPFTFAGYLGGIIGTVIAAAAQAGAILNSAKDVQAPKFAEGGDVFDVGGKPHSQGGTKYYGEDGNRFEVEHGEKVFVLKRTASEYIDRLGGLNEFFGGRSWSSPTRYAALGGNIPTGDGGYVTRSIKDTVEQARILETAIKNGFTKAPAPKLSIVELAKIQGSRNRSVTVSEL